MSAPRLARLLSGSIVALLSCAAGIEDAIAQWTYRAAPEPLVRNISVFLGNPVAGTNTLIVSTLTNGMHKGTDNGTSTTWQKISNGIPINQVRAHAVITPASSTNPVTDIYAATDGAGLYKTADGGANWTALNGVGTGALPCLDVRSIAVTSTPPATQPRTLLVSTSCRNNSGVFRSTDDGVNWTRLGPASGLGSLPPDVQSSALNRSGILFFLATSNYGIFKSIDDGATWALANAGLPGANVFSTSFSGALAGDTANLLAYVHGSGVYRSADTGASWVPSGTGLPPGYVSLGGINRQSGQTLYIGLDKQGVYKTIDGGVNWSAWGSTASDETAQYTRGTNATGVAGLYYLATLDGVVKTSNDGLTLQQLDDMGGGRFNSITHDRDSPSAIYVALHFPIKINYIYGDYEVDAMFTPLENGITGATSDGVVYQDRLAPATLYVTTNNRGIFKSTNGGSSFSAINIGLPSMIGQLSRLAIHPSDSQILYLGLSDAAGVYKSTNGGASWAASSSGLTTPFALSINHLAVDSTTPSNVWAATDAGVFKSVNSGASWTQMYSALDTAGSALPTNNVRVRTGNSNEIYIANNHANADGTLNASSGILKSIDGGANWANILPNQPASQVRVTVAGDVYAGVSARAGNPALYVSTGGGAFVPYVTGLQGSDIRNLGFASDDSALLSLSLENGFYTNDATQPAAPPVVYTIAEAPNNFANLVFPAQTIGTTSASRAVTVTNNGTTSATIFAVEIDNDQVFNVQSQTCIGTLAPGASCTVNVTVTPNTGANNSGSGGSLSVVGNFPPLTINLRSYGASPTLPTARLLQFPGAIPAYQEWTSMGQNFRELSFGNQTIGTSRILSYTLINYGGGVLIISPITVDNARFVLGGTCGSMLAPGASCLVSFTYTPTTVGQDLGNVNIMTDSEFLVAGQLNFSLTGVGETAGLEGSLIPTFGDNGRAFISTGPYGEETVVSLSHQPDGKTLVLMLARKVVDDGVTIAAVVRLNTDGTPDNSFGTNGVVRMPPPGRFPFTNGSSIFGLADGRILVSLTIDNLAQTATNTYVYRLLSNGQVDVSFGTAGSAILADITHDIRIAPDGKIVLGGLNSTQPANNLLTFARLTADGGVDASFGTNGRADVFLLDALALGQNSNLEVQADGKLVFSYSYGNGAARDIAVYRLATNGVQDTTWGTAGRVNLSLTNREDNARITRQQSDGKILLLSRTARAAFPSQQEFLLARLNPDGTLDTSFGTGGVVETLVAPLVTGGGDFASALRVLADGKIVVSGRRNCATSCATGQDIVVLRYLSNGTLDNTFGTGGIKTIALSRVFDSAHALDIDADGTIVVGGDIVYTDNDRGNTVGTGHVIKLKNTVGIALVNLTVSKVGSGNVTSMPAGIDCGGTCVASVAPGTMLTLTATATMGSTFAGWNGGGCSGTSTCMVTVNAAVTVTATFTGGPVTLVAVQSRKTHGGAGTFDLSVDTVPLIGGLVTVESRIIGAGHTIVFQFSGPVSSVGAVSSQDASSANIGSATATSGGNDVVVTITGVPDNRRARIALTNVNGAGINAEASMGFLVGDVNNSRSVTAADISGVKARSGQATTAANFKFDVNATGAVNASDISAVKARSGLTLP